MKRILIILSMLLAWSQVNATTIAYVVNSVTDTTTGVANSPTFDKQWIRFFNDRMGYTVKLITDDSAAAITVPSAYDGYFLSATISGAILSNLDTTSRGVVICDQQLYDDFHVGTGQRNPANIGTDWYLYRVSSTHAITKYMSNVIQFSYSSNSASCAFTGIPSGATVLFTPSNRSWDGETGTPDTAFCYAIETGGALTSGTAYGRRVVALPMYALLTTETNGGWCHPYELMGNICGWAWGDEENQYNADYNCYSTDRATPPEVEQAWWEFGSTSSITSTGNQTYYNGRFGFDSYTGGGFLIFRDIDNKVMQGHEIDSLVWTYRLRTQAPNYNVDAPPTGDLYSGFDFWVKLYKIIRPETWYTPLAYLNEGGNPYYVDTDTASATYGQTLWRGYNRANRTFITTGPLSSDSVRWSTIGLASGVDYDTVALDSFRFNATTFPSDGSGTATLTIPGSVFNDPEYNGFVWKTFDVSNGSDSTDMELIPASIAVIRDSRGQRFETYLSDASPQVLSVADTTISISTAFGAYVPDSIYNYIYNAGDGVIAVDSIRDNKSWLVYSPSSGTTTLTVNHGIDTTGFGIDTDTATVLVYSSGASNTPLTYYVIFTQTTPPVEAPPATVDKYTGLRRR